MKINKNPKHTTCIGNALTELKELQDFIITTRTPYFGKLLSKLVGTDTIPFLLFTEEGELKLTGFDLLNNECFLTSFFRIEKVDTDQCLVTLSLLRPLDIYGEETNSLCEVMKLRKTCTFVEVDINCIYAIQCLDTELLKRKIIIEPKW